MISKLEKYILKELFNHFILIYLILFVVFLLIQIGGLLKSVPGTIPLWKIPSIVPLIIPTFTLYFSFPITLLTFTVVSSQMRKRGENIALFSSGISIKEIARTYFFFSILVTLFNLYNIFYLLPATRYRFNRASLEILKEGTVSLLNRDGFSVVNNNLTVLVKKNNENNSILLFSDKSKLPVIISAENVKYVRGKILLERGVIIPLLERAGHSFMRFSMGEIPPSLLLPVKYKTYISEGEIPFPQLLQLQQKDFDPDYAIEINRRLILSLAVLLVTWAGLLPSGMKRGQEDTGIFIVTTLIFILFYLLMSTGRNIIRENEFSGNYVMWSTLLLLILYNEISFLILRKKV